MILDDCSCSVWSIIQPISHSLGHSASSSWAAYRSCWFDLSSSCNCRALLSRCLAPPPTDVKCTKFAKGLGPWRLVMKFSSLRLPNLHGCVLMKALDAGWKKTVIVFLRFGWWSLCFGKTALSGLTWFFLLLWWLKHQLALSEVLRGGWCFSTFHATNPNPNQ